MFSSPCEPRGNTLCDLQMGFSLFFFKLLLHMNKGTSKATALQIAQFTLACAFKLKFYGNI